MAFRSDYFPPEEQVRSELVPEQALIVSLKHPQSLVWLKKRVRLCRY
jgi:hypothetical protein